MIQSIFVYGLLIITLMALGAISAHRASLHPNENISFNQWQIILSIALFSLIFGMRYGVGTDHLNYLNEYLEGGDWSRYEWGFKIIRNVFSQNNVHYVFYFGTISLIQIFFLLYSFKDERYLYPFLIFTLFTGGYFITLINVIRQGVAVCIFFYAVKYIDQKKFFVFSFWCLVAFLFHKTALLLIILYPILANDKDFFKNRILQFGIISIAIAAYYTNFDIRNIIAPQVELAISTLNYDIYNAHSVLNTIKEGNTGIGFIIILMIDLIIILYSTKLKTFFNTNRFKNFYTLFFIGVIARILLAGSFILLRPFTYFTLIKLIISAYLFYYLIHNFKIISNKIAFLTLLLLHLIIFASYIVYGDQYFSTFHFFWQS